MLRVLTPASPPPFIVSVVNCSYFTPDDIARLAEWCHKYVELSKSELNLSANPRKFKILQHRKWPKWAGTEIDIAK